MLTVVVQGGKVTLAQGESRIEADLSELRSALDLAAGPEGRWVQVAEIAERLGASPSTVRYWCQEGRIPAVKHGRRWAVREDDLDAFEEGRR